MYSIYTKYCMFIYTRTLVKYLKQVALVQWPVGKGGCCKNVAVLLFQILDYIQLELTEVTDDLTCMFLILMRKLIVHCCSIKLSKPASKNETLQSRLQQPSTYYMFAEHVNVDDIRTLESGLKTVGTCDYLQGLSI